MISVTGIICIDHKGSQVDNKYCEGFQSKMAIAVDNLVPNLDISYTYILGGKKTPYYINHYLTIHLYKETLYLDYEDFFEKVVARLGELTGLDVVLFPDLEVEIPEHETVPCLYCKRTGKEQKLDSNNAISFTTCSKCLGAKRVLANKKDNEVQVIKYLCVNCSLTKGVETEVRPMTKYCRPCEIEKLNQPPVKEKKEESEIWKNKIIPMTKEMHILKNHQQLVAKKESLNPNSKNQTD